MFAHLTYNYCLGTIWKIGNTEIVFFTDASLLAQQTHKTHGIVKC